MVEEIEEELQEYFKNTDVKIRCEYVSLKLYKIEITLQIKNVNDIIMKTIIFYYNWSDKFTFSANIEQIKYNINKIIKEEK